MFGMKRFGFTLAETLVTIGIIGVVAALTIPAIVEKHQKSVVESKISKFYSSMNQVIKRSEVNNGPAEYWLKDNNYTTNDTIDFLNTYILPYMKHGKIKPAINNLSLSGVTVYLTDGSAFWVQNPLSINPGLVIYYYISADKRDSINSSNQQRELFLFSIFRNDQKVKNAMEPYTYAWNGNSYALYNDSTYGCKNGTSGMKKFYCAKILQLNGWKIPKDYPW